jgi:hypothetical protein
MTPFLLVDGHGSRFELPFLDYIHNPEHPWTVAIGVPYGTAKWQVGDSAEQNGQFKTQMTNKKQELMSKRMQTYNQSLGILPTDIMMMINHAWPLSFGNVRTNKKAIEERGWFPFNRNLLLDEEIRQTMTIDETRKEESNILFPNLRFNNDKNLLAYQQPTMRQPTNQQDNNTTPPLPPLNFSGGFSQSCLTKLVSQQDMQKARQSTYDSKKTGLSIKDKIKQLGPIKITAGKLITKLNTHNLSNASVYEKIKNESMIKKEQIALSKEKNQLSIADIRTKAIALIKDKGVDDVINWKNRELATVLRSMRSKGDGFKAVSTKPLMYEQFCALKHTVHGKALLNEGVLLRQAEELRRLKESTNGTGTCSEVQVQQVLVPEVSDVNLSNFNVPTPVEPSVQVVDTDEKKVEI